MRICKKLIDFHDAYRKYPAEALVDEWKLFIKLGIKVPEYLSLRQARRLLASKAVTNNRDIIKARLARFRRKMVLPRIRCYRDETRAWESLSLSAKRVVTALAYLSENSRANEAESLFSLFLPPKVRFSRPQFVWNPAVGLGCIGMNDRDGTAHIRLWSDESVKRYDLHYFRSVSFDSERVVAGLEGIALGKR